MLCSNWSALTGTRAHCSPPCPHCASAGAAATQWSAADLLTPAFAEVNAIEWDAWGLVQRNGKFRFPGFPPVAFLSMLVRLTAARSLLSALGWATCRLVNAAMTCCWLS